MTDKTDKTDKTEKTSDDETSQWQQLTPAEINAIVKQAQAHQAEADNADAAPEDKPAPEGKPTRRGHKPTSEDKPAGLTEAK